jgi:hypothetical protein
MNATDLRARRQRAAAEADGLDAELNRQPRRDLRIELDKPVALVNRVGCGSGGCRSPPETKGPARHQRTGPVNH